MRGAGGGEEDGWDAEWENLGVKWTAEERGRTERAGRTVDRKSARQGVAGCRRIAGNHTARTTYGIRIGRQTGSTGGDRQPVSICPAHRAPARGRGGG